MTTTPGHNATYTDGDRVLIEAEIVAHGRRIRTVKGPATNTSQSYLDTDQVIIHNPSEITDTEEVAGGSGSSRRAQDEPMTELIEHVVTEARAKFWEDGQTDHEFVAGVLYVLDIDGRLRPVPGTPDWAELRDRRTEDLNLRGLLSPNGYGRLVPMDLGESLVPAVEWLVDQVTTTRSHGEALHEALHEAVREAQREARDAQATVKAFDAWAAEVADFHGIGPDPERDVYGAIALHLRSTVEERDHLREDLTQIGLDLASERQAVTSIKTQLVNEQARLRGHLTVMRDQRDEAAANERAATTERDQLRLDLARLGAAELEREIVDECEGAPATLADADYQLQILEIEMADLGIAIPDGDTPVRAALDHIDRLTQTLDGLTWRAGYRHDELHHLRQERLTFLRQLADLQRTITSTSPAKRPASTGEDAGLAVTVTVTPAMVNGPIGHLAKSTVDGAR